MRWIPVGQAECLFTECKQFQATGYSVRLDATLASRPYYVNRFIAFYLQINEFILIFGNRSMPTFTRRNFLQR